MRVKPAILAVERDSAEDLNIKAVKQGRHCDDVRHRVVIVALGEDGSESSLVGLLGRLSMSDSPRHRRRARVAVQVNCSGKKIVDCCHFADSLSQ
jgi:hypothetical protein